MRHTTGSWKHQSEFSCGSRSVLRGFLIALIVWVPAAIAQNSTATPAFSTHATHLLGFEAMANNASGTLSVQNNTLRFQNKQRGSTQIQITAVRDVFLGEESKQVGGMPMTLGKAAVPFGGGRVVSLFAHKKYDIVALEYVDNHGGVHGAIFQVEVGQGEALRKELTMNGAQINRGQDQSAARTNGGPQ